MRQPPETVEAVDHPVVGAGHQVELELLVCDRNPLHRATSAPHLIVAVESASMDRFLEQMAYSDPVALVAGAVLLLFGRRLYWLALAGLGFLLGLVLAPKYFEVSGEIELVVALLAGVAGALFAVLAQKLAVALAGFGLGAVIAYYLALPYAESLAYQIWWVALLGAVLGLCFAAFLFQAALVATSVIVGAMLVTRGLYLDRDQEIWVFLVLAVVGLVVQTRGKKPPKDD